MKIDNYGVKTFVGDYRMLISDKNLKYLAENKEEFENSINKKHNKLVEKYSELEYKFIRHVPICKIEDFDIITLKAMITELSSMTVIRSRLNDTKIYAPSDFPSLYHAKITIENWLNDKMPMTWLTLENLDINKTFQLYQLQRYFNSIFIEYCVHKDMKVPYVDFDNQRKVEKQMIKYRNTFTDKEFAYMTAELGMNYEKWLT